VVPAGALPKSAVRQERAPGRQTAAVDRFHADLLVRGGIHALPERAHREQASDGCHACANQPGGDTEQYAAVHTPRLTRELLSACKGRLKLFIYEKFICARSLSFHC